MEKREDGTSNAALDTNMNPEKTSSLTPHSRTRVGVSRRTCIQADAPLPGVPNDRSSLLGWEHTGVGPTGNSDLGRSETGHSNPGFPREINYTRSVDAQWNFISSRVRRQFQFIQPSQAAAPPAVDSCLKRLCVDSRQVISLCATKRLRRPDSPANIHSPMPHLQSPSSLECNPAHTSNAQ